MAERSRTERRSLRWVLVWLFVGWALRGLRDAMNEGLEAMDLG